MTNVRSNDRSSTLHRFRNDLAFLRKILQVLWNILLPHWIKEWLTNNKMSKTPKIAPNMTTKQNSTASGERQELIGIKWPVLIIYEIWSKCPKTYPNNTVISARRFSKWYSIYHFVLVWTKVFMRNTAWVLSTSWHPAEKMKKCTHNKCYRLALVQIFKLSGVIRLL